MKRKFLFAALAAMTFVSFGCSNTEPEEEETVSQNVTATLADDGTGASWAKSDAIGVYTDASEKNVKYTTSSAGTSVSFAASTTVSGTPQYAYYPYSSSNSSLNATGLKGTLAQDQTAGADVYRYGVQTGTNSAGDVEFEFRNLFATVCFEVETAGSALEGQEIVSLNVNVTREGVAVPVVGSFAYSAADGSYTCEGYTTYNEFATASVATVFPAVQAGDVITVTAVSAEAEAVAEVSVAENFAAAGYYTIAVQLPEAEVVEPETPETEEPETEEPETEEPETEATTGTFTAATYNVDGLPKKVLFFTINGDGPGSDGTKTISSSIAADNWDFVGFSEDFAYHSELTSSLGAYTFGTYRGSVSSMSSNDTDGLGFYDAAGEDARGKTLVASIANEDVVGVFFVVNGKKDETSNNRVAEQLRSSNLDKRCPVAVIVAKMDLLEPEFDSNSYCLRTDYFDGSGTYEGSPLEHMIDYSSEEIRSYLKHAALLPNLEGFNNVKYFGVSSFNFLDSIHDKDDDANTPGKLKFICSSKRMELPFVWMLKQFGLIN